VSVWTYGAPELPYPGVATLAPCAATAILIATGGGSGTAVARFLSAPPLVFKGLVSYSLYLWHLPILDLFKWDHIDDIAVTDLLILLVATYAIAVLSWRFIEHPVRTRSVLQSNRTFLITVAAASTALLAIGITFWSSQGFPQRFGPAVVPSPWPPPHWECAQRTPEQIAAGELCSYGPTTGEAARALVWGDSYAVMMMSAYEDLARSRHIRIYFAARPSCLPLLDVSNLMLLPAMREPCTRFNTAVVEAIKRLKPDLVVLNERWAVTDASVVPDPGLIHPKGTSNFQLGLEQTLQHISAA
jgi:hypothetical protein